MPFIPSRRPKIMDLQPGTYQWCACGRSAEQPFCDGSSHRGSGIEPVEIIIEETRRVYLCQCKHTGSPPWCDGTHGDV